MKKEIIESIEKLWSKDGHLNEDQRDFLIDLLQDIKPKFCIETGFATGRSTITTLLSCQPEKLVSVDINLDYMLGAREYSKKLQEIFPCLSVIESNSRTLLNKDFFDKEFSKGVDFAFVDGDHTYDGALHDLKAIFLHLNEKGVIVVDDYFSGPPNGCSIPDVDKAVNDFAKNENLSIERWHLNGKGFAILRKI